MEQNITYDAFISYRHCKPDSEIASKLHKKLESYKLPKEIAEKVGKKSFNRVFRDEAELAVSDDLSEAIEKAINSSEYLIAICSPEYLKSAWCMKEIEAFLEHSDRKHILLVLADGEPVEAFPDILKYDEFTDLDDNGNEVIVRKPVEPLAADCRGENSKDRSNAVENAVLRLTAAMIGVGYDDLNQRHRKEQNRKRTARTLTAFGILGIFTAVCLFFLIKIYNQNTIISQRYSDTLASTSVNLLRDGRRKDAVYVARMALDKKKKASYSESATQALADSLGIYNEPNTLSCDRDIMLPCSVSDFKVSYQGNYMAVLGLEHIRYIVNSRSEEIVYFYDEPDFNEVYFDGERGLVFQKENNNYWYFDLRTLSETNLGITDGRILNEDTKNGYAIADDNGVYLFNGSNLECSFIYSEQVPFRSDRYDAECIYSPDGSRALIVLSDYDNEQTYFFTYDFSSGLIERKEISYEGNVTLSFFDGEYIYWRGNDSNGYVSLYKQNIDDVWDVVSINITDDIYGLFASDGYVVTCCDDSISILDNELNIVDTVKIESYSYGVVSDGEIIILDYEQEGFYRIINGECSYCATNEANASLLENRVYVNSTLYISKVGENHISTYTFGDSDYISPYYDEFKEIQYYDYDAFERRVFKEKVMGSNPNFSEELIYDVVLCENSNYGLVQLWDGQVNICDETGKIIKTVYAMEGMVMSFYYDEANGYYYINANNLEVYDKNFKNIYRIPGCTLLGSDPTTKNPVVSTWRDNEMHYYLLTPVTYDRLLEIADEFLGGFEPDERVKEKYSLE